MGFQGIKDNLGIVTSLVFAKLTGRRVPISSIVCVNNRCNLKCWYCYGEHPARENEREYSTQMLFDIIDGLKKLGTRIFQVQGGEPLLRDDLGQVLEYAKSKGMVCDMVTNAVLLEKRSDILKLIDRICISLDGPEETNDRNRGKNTFKAVMRGIDIALEAGLSVRLSAVLTAESTREDIDWLVDFSRKKGVLVNFSPSFDFVPTRAPETYKPHKIPDEHMRGLLLYLEELKKQGSPIQFTAKSFELARTWPFAYDEKKKATAGELPDSYVCPPCYHGRFVIFIDSDGFVYPCCNFWGQSKLNLYEQSLSECWEKMGQIDCKACHIPAYIDRNLFFDMSPGVWFNYIRQTLGDLLCRNKNGSR